MAKEVGARLGESQDLLRTMQGRTASKQPQSLGCTVAIGLCVDGTEAISIEGADPDWQISELRKILDLWASEH
jgi:hypothetical protein